MKRASVGGLGGQPWGRMALCPLLCEPPLLSPFRYQEVQTTQKALGRAVSQALPEAERALAAVQRVRADAALGLASPAAPSALVSPAGCPRAQPGVGVGEGGGWEASAAQAWADDVAYF